MTKNENAAFERKMAQKNNSIVTIKNPTKNAFTHSYDGFSYTIEAGETLPFPYPVGMHLAKHLAMKMSRDDAQKGVAKGADKSNVNMYSEQRMSKYLSQIIVDRKDQPLPAQKSEGELMREKTQEMQESQGKDANDPAAKVTKKSVMEELDKRKIRYNPRDSKEDLLAQLTQAEMDGNTGEEDESEE